MSYEQALELGEWKLLEVESNWVEISFISVLNDVGRPLEQTSFFDIDMSFTCDMNLYRVT